jgi:hypothetical protein
MKKLLKMLQAAGGLELEIREHPLWVDVEKLSGVASKFSFTPLGPYQLLASSSVGTLSIIQAKPAFSRSDYLFEIVCIAPSIFGLFEGEERYPTREAVCRRVCSVLASVTMQIVGSWRAEHGS